MAKKAGVYIADNTCPGLSELKETMAKRPADFRPATFNSLVFESFTFVGPESAVKLTLPTQYTEHDVFHMSLVKP